MTRSYRTITALAVASLLVTALARERAAGQEPGGPHLELPQVLERGDSGTTLLLIPCAGCGARSWDRFMEANEHRFRMTAVTLPGYDGSPRPELPLWTDQPLFQQNAIQQISELVDERGLMDVVVVGQSFGVTIALAFANRRPDVVRAVVSVDALPTNATSVADQTPDERFTVAQQTVDQDWALQLQDPERYRTFNAARSLPDAESRLLHHGMFMASDRVAMLHYWRENILHDRNPAFRGLEVPYLDVDAISSRAENPDSVAAAHLTAVDEVGRPRAYTLVRSWNTSHWVHVERPDELGALIGDFLAGRAVADLGTRP